MATIETREGSLERRILLAMARDKSVLGRISSKWGNEGLFPSSASNTVASLCVEYYRKHNEAPNRNLLTLYAAWMEKHADREQQIGIEQLLGPISDAFGQDDGQNSDHIIDIAGKYFNQTILRRLADGIRDSLDAGMVDRAEELLAKYHKVELGSGAGVDLFTDMEEVQSVFVSEEEDCLVPYGGALKRFFHGTLCRDAFVAFLGSEKSGKSWHLLDIAWRAMSDRKRVAYFEAGDMSQRQVERRFLSRASRHPYRSTGKDGEWPCEVEWPVSLCRVKKGDKDGEPVYDVEIEEKKTEVFDGPLDFEKAWGACRETIRKYVRSKKSYFKLSCHPNSTINVAGINSMLDAWELDGWTPDVVVVDYADILAPPPGRMEPRDQINLTWKQLRTLSQERHCLVVTATQANADSYGKYILEMENFSEDKRKFAHVTAMAGINVTDGDKKKNMARLNWLVKREGEYSVSACVTVARCLPLANPCVCSIF